MKTLSDEIFFVSGTRGVYDRKITALASCGNGKYERNASRNLYRFIHKSGKTLPVEITPVTVPIKVSRRKKVQQRQWPVLHLSSWLQVCFEEYGGFFVLGGHKLDDLKAIENMLEQFWSRHQFVDTDIPQDTKHTIPFLLHGDEGRGQCKRPILVLSFQPMIGWSGGEHVNSKKNFAFEENVFDIFDVRFPTEISS